MSERRPVPGAHPPSPLPIEVRLTDETISYLDGRMRTAVAEGIKDAMNKENARAFWSAGVDVFRENAEEHTGRLVIGGLRGLASKMTLFLLLGGMVYAVGGWSALAKLWATLFHVVTP